MYRRLAVLVVMLIVVPYASTQHVGDAPPSTPPDSTKLELVKSEDTIHPLVALREDDGVHRLWTFTVWLKAEVSEEGNIENVEVISGDNMLVDAAVNSCKKLKYKPSIKNGKAIKVTTTLPFDFVYGRQVLTSCPPDGGEPAASNTSSPRGGSSAVALAPKRVRITEGMSLNYLMHRVLPVYPNTPQQNGIQKPVAFCALISKHGVVEKLTPISGPPELIPGCSGAICRTGLMENRSSLKRE